MRWEDEPYVRVFKRESPEWTLLPWEARLLWNDLLKRFDRAGLLELGVSGAAAIASATRVPIEIVEVGIAALLDDGCCFVVADGRGGQLLVCRNYLQAQEALVSDAQRKRASRERAAGLKRREAVGLPAAPVRWRDQARMLPAAPPAGSSPPADGGVTPADAMAVERPARSRLVTHGHSVQCSAVQDSTDPEAEGPPPPQPEVEPIPPDAPPEIARILAELGRHRVLAPLARLEVAEVIEGRRMARGRPLEHVLVALGELAADAVTGGWSTELVTKRLRTYTDAAKGDRVSSGGTAATPSPVSPAAAEVLEALELFRAARRGSGRQAYLGAPYVEGLRDLDLLAKLVAHARGIAGAEADARIANADELAIEPGADRPTLAGQLTADLLSHWFAEYHRDNGDPQRANFPGEGHPIAMAHYRLSSYGAPSGWRRKAKVGAAPPAPRMPVPEPAVRRGRVTSPLGEVPWIKNLRPPPEPTGSDQ